MSEKDCSNCLYGDSNVTHPCAECGENSKWERVRDIHVSELTTLRTRLTALEAENTALNKAVGEREEELATVRDKVKKMESPSLTLFNKGRQAAMREHPIQLEHVSAELKAERAARQKDNADLTEQVLQAEQERDLWIKRWEAQGETLSKIGFDNTKSAEEIIKVLVDRAAKTEQERDELKAKIEFAGAVNRGRISMDKTLDAVVEAALSEYKKQVEALTQERDEARKEFKVRWIPVEESMPCAEAYVLAFFVNAYGKPRRIRAFYAPRYTVTTGSDNDWYEYQDGDDELYLPEGWYECNEYEETHWHVTDKVTHWMPLPCIPDAFRALPLGVE